MKHLLVIAALFVSTMGFAQSAQEEVDLLQSLYGMQKKDLSLIHISEPTRPY